MKSHASRWRKREIVRLAVALVVITVSAVGAAPRRALPRERGLDEHVIRATRIYRAALEHNLPVYEDDVRRATDELARQRAYAAQGAGVASQLRAAERELAAATARLAETRRELHHAELFLAELEPRGPVTRGEGAHRWALGELSAIERFYRQRFARPLPVSARGQTAVHDRMGYDHRNAVDVAVQPDSVEGRALIEYLRETGVPFIAFRGAVRGAATGAHVHIGPPSARIVSPASGS